MLIMKLIEKLNIKTVFCVDRPAGNIASWARFSLNIFFGAVVVCSFILILILTMRSSQPAKQSSSCLLNNCRVVCSDIYFYSEHNIDIENALSRATLKCASTSLELLRPIFAHKTLPENWMSGTGSHVKELYIKGGNLRHILPHSLLSTFTYGIQVLSFENIKISKWSSDTFLGLSNLKELHIKDSVLLKIEENALHAIDDTLKVLTVNAYNFWSPNNLTGSSNPVALTTVDFSFNTFYDILNNITFSSIKKCKYLYLNSCQIKHLGLGTFDKLIYLERLYLNDNLLATIPLGLFDKLTMSNIFKIALHDNYWICECTQNELRILNSRDTFLIQPTCYYPYLVNGMTFADFEIYCGNNESSFTQSTKIIENPVKHKQNINCNSVSINIAQFNMECHENDFLYGLTNVVTPKKHCISNRITNFSSLNHVFNANYFNADTNNWISPSYYVENRKYSMIEMSLISEVNVGIVWYQSLNRTKVYCMVEVPDALQIYNVEVDQTYTFCPFNETSGIIYDENCVVYDLSDFKKQYIISPLVRNILIYISISFGALLIGALCVFIIINKKPTLLKRNKRVLLVKHKTIDALILPPEIPTRRNILKDIRRSNQLNVNDNIFVLPHMDLETQHFKGTTSMRSSESNDASYISPLSPSEGQLNDWRADERRRNRISNSDDDVSTVCSIYDSIPYYSLYEKLYEDIQ